MADAYVEQPTTRVLNSQRAWLYELDAAGLSDLEIQERLEEVLGLGADDAAEVVTRYRCGL